MNRFILNRRPLKEDPYSRILYGSADSRKSIQVKAKLKELKEEGVGLTETSRPTGDITQPPPKGITYSMTERGQERGNISYAAVDFDSDFDFHE
jgi:hypothetical protein